MKLLTLISKVLYYLNFNNINFSFKDYRATPIPLGKKEINCPDFIIPDIPQNGKLITLNLNINFILILVIQPGVSSHFKRKRVLTAVSTVNVMVDNCKLLKFK